MKNRIAKLVDVNKIEIFEEDLPSLKKDEVLVKVKSTGICGSDLHYFEYGGLGSFKEKMPMYIGHEPSGKVVDGEFETDARVAIEPGKSCVTSKWSILGKHNLCTEGTFMGANTQGSFADYVIVDKSQLIQIPDTMSYNMATLLEPLGVALHAIKLLNVNLLDNVMIAGAGPVGLCVMFICKMMGCQDIYFEDNHQYRLDYALKHGGKLNKNNNKVSVVFDCAGNDDSINKCIVNADLNSRMGLIGIPTQDYIEYNPHKTRTKEMLLQNVRRSNITLSDCLRLFINDNEPESMVTHEFDLEKIQEGFELVSNRQDEVIKCIIRS